MNKFKQLFEQMYLESITTSDLKNYGKDDDSLFDKKVIEDGIKVELEHTTNKEVAKQIAKDHIKEMGYKNIEGKITSDYYSELSKLENKLKTELKNKK